MISREYKQQLLDYSIFADNVVFTFEIRLCLCRITINYSLSPFF